MPNLILFDTSNESCAVGVYYHSQLYQFIEPTPRQHAKKLLPALDDLLAEAGASLNEFDAVACSVGPGAFTGIRIAVAAAQGLALALDIDTIAVNTLAALAQKGATEQPSLGQWLVIQDARMQKVYCQLFSLGDAGQLIEQGPVKELLPDQVTAPEKSFAIIGTGIEAYHDQLEHLNAEAVLSGEKCRITAADMLPLALDAYAKENLISYDQLLPLYVRNEVAVKAKDRQ